MLSMKMSAAARQQLVEASEGKRLKAYRDCIGVLTIGYGHTSAAGLPIVAASLTITDAQADVILATDLGKFERGVCALLEGVAHGVLQREFDALVDLAFNIGLGNLRSSSLLAAYRKGDLATTAQKFMDWNKAGGHVVTGLTIRRRKDAAWFLDGRIARTGVATLLSPEDLPIAHAVDHADSLLAQWWHGRSAPALAA